MRLTFKWVPGISLGRGDPLIILSPFALVAKIHIYGRFLLPKFTYPYKWPYSSSKFKSSFQNSSTDWKSVWWISSYGLPKTLHLIDLSGGKVSRYPINRSPKGPVEYKRHRIRILEVQTNILVPHGPIGPLFRSSNFSLVPSSNFGLLE